MVGTIMSQEELPVVTPKVYLNFKTQCNSTVYIAGTIFPAWVWSIDVASMGYNLQFSHSCLLGINRNMACHNAVHDTLRPKNQAASWSIHTS